MTHSVKRFLQCARDFRGEDSPVLNSALEAYDSEIWDFPKLEIVLVSLEAALLKSKRDLSPSLFFSLCLVAVISDLHRQCGIAKTKETMHPLEGAQTEEMLRQRGLALKALFGLVKPSERERWLSFIKKSISVIDDTGTYTIRPYQVCPLMNFICRHVARNRFTQSRSITERGERLLSCGSLFTHSH